MNLNAEALHGLRVVDLTRVLGGPYCTQILGDHGAEVVKVEPPSGDETRGWGPPFDDGVASYFLGVNRNKKSIVLDLSMQKDRDVLLSLLRDADVLVENFKPGTLKRWGLDYEGVLSKKFPKLIHCCISGFGEHGPLGGLPGYDAAIQAICGLMSVNGEAQSGSLRIGVPIVDLVTGLNAMIGILLALQERERSKLGQSIDISLYDCALSVLHPHSANYFYSGKTPVRSGNRHSNISPYDAFETATSPIFLAVGNDSQFKKLASHLGRPELAEDCRFRSNADRVGSHSELKCELEELLRNHDGVRLADELARIGVPSGAVQTIDQALTSPHTKFRNMIVELDGYRGTASPIKMSRSQPTYRLKPPRLGEHNDEVLEKSISPPVTQGI